MGAFVEHFALEKHFFLLEGNIFFQTTHAAIRRYSTENSSDRTIFRTEKVSDRSMRSLENFLYLYYCRVNS